METMIITDSAADLPASLAKQKDIEIITLPVSFDGESVTDADEFWARLLAGGLAKTSQPSPEDVRSVFERAKAEGKAAVFITISSALSGTYETAVQLAKETEYEHLYVLDSRCASLCEGVIAEEAASLRDAGLSASEIYARLTEFRSRVRLCACINTLQYLARGGRISPVVAKVGSLLHIKPMITFLEDGSISVCAKVPGLAKAQKKLLELLPAEKLDPAYPLTPIFSYESDNAETMIENCKSAGIAVDETRLFCIGPTIGTHIGPGGFGVVYVLKKETDGTL